MGWTIGSMMFYVGLIGACITLVAAVVTGILLGKSRTRLKAKLDKEYGTIHGKSSPE